MISLICLSDSGLLKTVWASNLKSTSFCALNTWFQNVFLRLFLLPHLYKAI